MLRVQPQIIHQLRGTKDKEALFPFLQRAIELEHSTIPPYLTAWYSLKPGLNDAVGALLRSIVIEEMLHMTIAANILVSLGGHPAINHEGFVPSYPGGLPMGIGGSDFVVHIEAFSMQLVKNTFMVIEEPEHPVPTTTEAWDGSTPVPDPVDAPDPDYRTIGEFYAALKERLATLPESAFGHEDRQVLGVWPESLNFPIVSAEAAGRAIDIIVEQGEGSSTDPFEEGQPAHFYRFGEIYYGAELICTPGDDSPTRYAYDGAPIAFVPDGVFPMRPDPGPLQFPAGTFGRMLSDNFTQGYSSLLNSLHDTFNGKPQRIREVMGLMYQLRFLAQRLMSTPLHAGRVETAGPVYRYVEP
ncbi:MAG: ferritin-like protein [Deltaproteobacteria bacterium]|nr:ferritin-like protein [Deltaproteobacteria bacterium]